jgi:hypothetical protein
VDNKLFHQTDSFVGMYVCMYVCMCVYVCKSGKGGTAKPISYSLHPHEYSL